MDYRSEVMMSDDNLNNNDAAFISVQEQPHPAIKWGWLRATILLIVWFIVYAVLSGAGALLVIIVSGQDPTTLMSDAANLIETLGIGATIFISLTGFGGTMLCVWIFRRFIDRRSLLSLGFEIRNYGNDLLAGMGWGAGLIVIGFAVLYLSGMLEIQALEFQPGSFFLYFILFSLVSLNEEILIRGYVLTNLMDSMNKYLALLVSSVLFALLHLANANMSVPAFINLILAGLILGIYYIHKRNLWFPIGMHLTWNFFQGPVFGFEVSGNKTSSIIIQNVSGPDLLTGGEFGLEGSLLATVAIVLITLAIHWKHRPVSYRNGITR